MRNFRDKIKTIEEIAQHTGGKKVAMCHGVFDLLHPGHVEHLEEARNKGDVLVVGVTCDQWVHEAKGEGHPRFSHDQRAEQLAALEVVDYVVIDWNPTPLENLRILRPQVYVKGPDYATKGVSWDRLQQYEVPVLREVGAELYFTTATKTYSSSQLHKDLDVGPYHADPAGYKHLVEKTYADVPNISMPVEFLRCIPDNLLMLTVRLARYKFVAKMLSKTDIVLEVGSGYGLGAIFMAQFCKAVIGLDVQKSCVDEAKRFNPRKNVTFYHQDFLHNSPLATHDVVAAMDVIEHLTVSQAEKFIEQLADSIRPTGMAVIGTPSFYSWPLQSEFSQLSHVHCYQQEELRDMLLRVFGRVLCFSMNDEVVHTGHPAMAWYYYFLCFCPKEDF